MNTVIKKLFSRKEDCSLIPELRTIMGRDEVVNVTRHFATDHLPTAEGIIIIWATKGELCIDVGGLTEAEVIGSMQIMGHQIEHHGVPS